MLINVMSGSLIPWEWTKTKHMSPHCAGKKKKRIIYEESNSQKLDLKVAVTTVDIP